MGKAVIKAGDTSPVAIGSLRLDLRDVTERVDATLADARHEGRRLVEEARRQADLERTTVLETARRQGYETGLAAGRQQGYEQALAEARTKFDTERAALGQALAGMVGAFSAQREELFVAARQDVVVLAVAIASRVVRRLTEVESVAAAAVRDAAAAAVELIGAPTEVVVRVNPADAAALRELAGEDAVRDSGGATGAVGAAGAVNLSLGRTRHVRLVEDATVARGGAVVSTADCEVDATAQSRIDRVADELLATWRERAAALGIAQE